MLRKLSIIIISFIVVSCGFRPLYRETPDDARISPVLASVDIAGIPERSGQILKGYLRDYFNPINQSAEKLFRLEIRLNRELTPLVIERDSRITRYNLVFSADFFLKETATGKLIYSGNSKMIGSFDASDAEFSVYTAEEDTAARTLKEMAKDIKLKVAAYFLNNKAAHPGLVELNVNTPQGIN